MANVNVARGMRDLLPETMRKRRAVIQRIEHIFRSYGFDPLETPAVERIETLMGKYGDEGSKLIFKILARGEAGDRGECDMALRYDLTVPLARVVAMNQQLKMPFKRYQIQPVWRADRPQKGRFREFYQCDVDVVGTQNTMAEAECLAVVHDSLKALGFDRFTIRLNDRRLLRAMVSHIGALEQEFSVIGTLDKLDKIGEDGVRQDLLGLGLEGKQIDALFDCLNGADIPEAESIEAELLQIRNHAIQLGVSDANLSIDRTLARGLDYYTGPVFETVLDDAKIGSVSGGGRYDGLIGMFLGRDVPAVGVSLGLERLITILEERGQLDGAHSGPQVFVSVFSSEQQSASLEAAKVLRQNGIRVELSYRVGKLGKQFKLASQNQIPFVLVIGPDDVEKGCIQIKDLATGEQHSMTLASASEWLKARLG
ncbi:MAG: histidine--tRNA ligase [Myxococcota bacterium]|nr:histidine--tRNA ligase [Myxococcota bacterium]